MRAKHSKHGVSQGKRVRRGFTLVELMLVMFILSVLVSLVVGVSWYVIEQSRKTETLDTQRRLMAVVDAYRKVTNKLPYYRTPGDRDYNPNGTSYQKDPDEHMKRLMEVLEGKYNTTVANDSTIKAMLGETANSMTSDAYGKSMIFLSDKGVGGNPVIISAGPDGVFGYETGLADPQRYKEDNIRSDTSN